MKSFKAEIVNTTEQISELVDWLIFHHVRKFTYSPTMYIDLDGVDLCHEGSISIFTLLVDTGISITLVYLIDDEKIPKVFFDVRNDLDALFAHFGVALQGAEDIQLMESATRKTTASRNFLSGLTKCVESKAFIYFNYVASHGRASWKLAKEKGEQLFTPKHGGSYDIFNERPIPKDIISYCVGDVQCLPELRYKFCMLQTRRWKDLVSEETKKRVAASQKSDFEPHGPDKALAPWDKEQNTTLDEWNYVCPPRDDRNDDWDDGGPTSCRDIISNADYDYYSSD